MAATSLVLGREKRSTAGNRLRALLDKAHEIDAEKGFEEVEDDKDFEDLDQQADVFDEDFASTASESESHDPSNPNSNANPSTLTGPSADRLLQRQEKDARRAEKNKGRGYHDPFAYLKKGPKQQVQGDKGKGKEKSALKRVGDVGEGEREGKRRRVSVVAPGEEAVLAEGSSPAIDLGSEEDDNNVEEDEEDDSSHLDRGTDSPIPRDGAGDSSRTRRYLSGRKTTEGESRRSTMRSSTLKDRREVDERVQEAVAQRLTNPLSRPRKPHPSRSLTQADLIALALEREESNRESLNDWLAKEEERRKKVREGRRVVAGARVSWVSRRGERVVEVVEEGEAGGSGGPKEGGLVGDARAAFVAVPRVPGVVGTGIFNLRPIIAGPSSTQSATKLPHPPFPFPANTILPPPPMIPSTSSSMAPLPIPTPTIPFRPPTQPPTAVYPPSTSSSPMPPSALPPTIPPYPSVVPQPAPEPAKEPYTRNYVVLHQIPDGQRGELQALLGDHADWTRMPFVSLRNRPLTRRRPICPITGLPAKYRHPSTNTPYANTHAYRTIEAVLKGEYRWSSVNNVFLGGEEGVGMRLPEGLEGEVPGWGIAYGFSEGMDEEHGGGDLRESTEPMDIDGQVESEIGQSRPAGTEQDDPLEKSDLSPEDKPDAGVAVSKGTKGRSKRQRIA